MSHYDSGVNENLCRAPEDFQIYAVALALYLAKEGVKDGKIYQEFVRNKTSFSGIRWTKALENAAKIIKNKQIKVLKLAHSTCPHVLFSSMLSRPDAPIVSFFNSRISRLVKASDLWLIALKHVLESSTAYNIHYVVSSGHLPYEIVDVWAKRENRVRLKVEPGPLRYNNNSSELSLSCCLWPIRCNRRQMMQCRDRIIALISNGWVIVYLRKRSSLIPMLISSFETNPIPVAIWIPSKERALKTENLNIAKAIHPVFKWNVPHRSQQHTPGTIVPKNPAKSEQISFSNIEKIDIPWNEYLYHYTRPSLGPMHGESRAIYIKRLLDGDPMAANTAIDILINIARSGVLKASRGIVKGGFPVVSFTSVPPIELKKIKKWNKASVRWTIGDCGIAIKKDKLKEHGAKPVCYVSPKFYFRLPPSERYRYQKHEAPNSLWKHEKEWRILGDVLLSEFDTNSAFWFVPSAENAEKLRKFVGQTVFPIISLKEAKIISEAS